MKLKKYKLSIALLLVFMPVIVFIQTTEPALASVAQGGLDAAAGQAGFATGPEANISTVIVKVINGFLSIFGMVLLYFIITGGFMWMTSGGNADKVLAAKTTIKNALIGMAITAMAYILTSYIIGALQVNTGLVSPPDPAPPNLNNPNNPI